MALDREVRELRHLVEKQKQTIKTQSETISGGMGGGKGQPGYGISSAPSSEQHRTPATRQTPPSFELFGSGSNTIPCRRREVGSGMPTLQQLNNLSLNSPSEDDFQNQINQDPSASLTSRSMNPQSPHESASFYSNYQQLPAWPSHPVAPLFPRPENFSTPTKHGGSAPRTPDPASMKDGAFAGTDFINNFPSTPHCAGPNSGVDDTAPDRGFTRKFSHLFRMTERYCYTHMNFPSAAKDSQLPSNVKERLMKAATRESAHQLGSTGSTRYLLMTKVILQWFIKHVFTQSLFASFDYEADRRIAACKDQIYQDTPAYVKHELLLDISKEIRLIRDNANFPHFLDTLIGNQAKKLWDIVRPLMHQRTAMDWEDLRVLLHQAYSVAGDMASGPYEWRFEFAPVGSFYNSSMVNRDPYVQGKSEQELDGRGLVIRLGFSPVVYLRDNTSGAVRTEPITRHQILLKS